MPSTGAVVFGPYRLDSRGKSLFRGGVPVGLSPYEFEVLHLLVRRPNVVLLKDVLIRAGWQATAVCDNSLEKLVSKLRRHLDADDLERHIRTVPRQGYQFVAPVTEVEGESPAWIWSSCWRPMSVYGRPRGAGIAAARTRGNGAHDVPAAHSAASGRRRVSDWPCRRLRDAV